MQSFACCDSCGRSYGKGVRCEWCGVRRFRRYNVWLFLLLVFLFVIRVFYSKPNVVNVASLSFVDNFSVVSLDGYVKTIPYRLADGGLYFIFQDTTGSLPIFLREECCGVPLAVGDAIKVSGRVKTNTALDLSLYVSSEDRFSNFEVYSPRCRGEVEADLIGSLSCDMIGQKKVIRGIVVSSRKPAIGSRAPYQLIVKDGSGTIPVVFWPSISKVLERIPQRHDLVMITGILNLYRGEMQIKVLHVGAIVDL